MPEFNDIPKNINEIIAQHTKLYLQDPEKAHIWDSTPVGVPGPITSLLLTTTGRKTASQRHVPLLYVDNDGSYLIIGSKGGDPKPPSWYLNLQANSSCEIRVASLHCKADATILEGDARKAAWQKITGKHPVYLKYQARTERQIPVVRLTPAMA